jgi:leucyl/phenylalanyl-tRNA--protein transferase
VTPADLQRFLATSRIRFPDPSTGPADEPLAIGGDLRPGTLLRAYTSGIFPWSTEPITWWSPDPRGILPFEDFHVSRRIERIIRQGRFQITTDQAFRDVITRCSSVPRREDDNETWISPIMIDAYCRLHALGWAHSVEAWHDQRLVGGLYGVAIGGLFAGESMFHTETNASTVALTWLVRRLATNGYTLFDIQMLTPHLERLGGTLVPRNSYLSMLRDALHLNPEFPKTTTPA